MSSRLVVPLRAAIDGCTLIYHGLFCELVFGFLLHDTIPNMSSKFIQFADPIAQVIMYSDLESDYINPIDLCNKINQVFSIFD